MCSGVERTAKFCDRDPVVVVLGSACNLIAMKVTLIECTSCAVARCAFLRRKPWLARCESQSGKCNRFGAGRSWVRCSAGSYEDLVCWYCSLLTRHTVYRRAAGNTPRTQKKQTEWNEARNCTNSVVAFAVIKRHCSYKAPTTNHHIKKKSQSECRFLHLRRLKLFCLYSVRIHARRQEIKIVIHATSALRVHKL